MIDMHTHSLFSGDSKELPDKIVQTAVAAGMKMISITDHYDPNCTREGYNDEVNFETYFDVLQSLRAAYPDIYIAAGLELGFNPQSVEHCNAFFRRYPFENVIMSVHQIDGLACHKPEYFDDKNKQNAYDTYLRAVLESVKADCYFCTLGHLGYIERYAPYSDAVLYYNEHKELIDEILRCLIDRNKILELNARRGGLLPNAPIVERYRELGGSLITYGSDAHNAKQVGQSYQAAAAFAQSLGFKGWTVAKDRKYEVVAF